MILKECLSFYKKELKPFLREHTDIRGTWEKRKSLAQQYVALVRGVRQGKIAVNEARQGIAELRGLVDEVKEKAEGLSIEKGYDGKMARQHIYQKRREDGKDDNRTGNSIKD